MKKRFFCMLLALALCLTLLPTAALADALAEQDDLSPAAPIAETPAESPAESPAEPADPVAEVQQLIDALPTAAEVAELGADDRDTAYLAAQDACDAMDALTGEQQAQLTGLDKLEELLEWFNGQIMTTGKRSILTVGTTSVDTTKDASGTDWSYDASTNTLTLNNYNSSAYYTETKKDGYKKENYLGYRAMPGSTTCMAYCCIYADGDLNIDLRGTNRIQLGDDQTKYYDTNRYAWTSNSNEFSPGYVGICTTGNLSIKGYGSNSLAISAGLYAIRSGGSLTVDNATLDLSCTRDCVFINSNITIKNKSNVTATATGDQLAYFGIGNNGTLTVDHATVTGISKGKKYESKEPAGITSISKITVRNSGKLTGKSYDESGSGIYAGNAIELDTYGEAYGYAYGTTSHYGIFVNTALTINQTGYLYAETESTINEGEYDALIFSSSLTQTGTNGATVNVITKVNDETGTYACPCQVSDNAYTIKKSGQGTLQTKKVEITGIRRCYLYLSTYTATASKGNRTYLFSPAANYPVGYTYAEEDSSNALNLGDTYTVANGEITTLRRSDVALCKGIIVDSGSHTIILPKITRTEVQDANGNSYNPLSGSFITVKSGATLTVKLNGASYLEYHSTTPLIKVESGGTLILEDYNGTGGALSLINKTGKAIEAASGANIIINGGTIFTGKYETTDTNSEAAKADNLNLIGGDEKDITITVNGGYVESDLMGNLVVNGGTISSKSKYHAVDAYAAKFANTITVTGGSVGMKVIDSSGTETTSYLVKTKDGVAACRTQVTLIRAQDLKDAKRAVWTSQTYHFSVSGTLTKEMPEIQSMLLEQNGTQYSYNLNDLYGELSNDGNCTIYLYLPDGCSVNNVSIQTTPDQGEENNPFVSDLTSSITTKSQKGHSTSGYLAMRTMVLGSQIMALKQDNLDNKFMCPSYTGNDTVDQWYVYNGDNDMSLGNVGNHDNMTVTGFGIRSISGNHKIIVRRLQLSGENKRLQIDNGSLDILLYGTSSFTANDTDPVVKLSGTLNISGSYKQDGKTILTNGRLTLKGAGQAFQTDYNYNNDLEVKIFDNALSVKDAMLINECTGVGGTYFTSLRFDNATVIGLGQVKAFNNNIVINGGSVDIDVGSGTVKNANGNVLTKQSFQVVNVSDYTQISTLNISGLPKGVTFAADCVWTDKQGNIHLWLPEGAKLESATIGDTTYYATTNLDGNNVLSTEKKPEFSAPASDTTLLREAGESFTLTAAATGAPTPTYQWQASTDGSTWTDIDGATSKTYTATFSSTMDGYQYRCKASNSAGVEYSNIFTLYNVPAIATQPVPQTVTADNTATFTVTGGAANSALAVTYQWQIKNGDNWDNIEGAIGNSYTTSATDISMDGQQYRCVITYAHGTVSDTMTSNAATLTVVGVPKITTQPVSRVIKVGETATFSVEADGNHDLSYQWQVSTDGGSNWADISDATADSYTSVSATAAMNGWQYRCMVTNTSGGVSNPLPSEGATLTVVAAPVISGQPRDVLLCIDDTATFTVTASGNQQLSYQWQLRKTDRDGKPTGEFADLAGATEASYTTEKAVLDMDGWQYRCIVTNTCDDVALETISEAAVLSVLPPAAIPNHEDEEPEDLGNNPFVDVTPEDYFYDSVLWAVENGITGGMDATHFAPAQACTRAQLAAFLYRFAQSQGEGFTGLWMFRLPFSDVPEWCYDAVAWCYEKNIVQGYGNGLFGSNDPVTREQVVTMLYRFAVAMGYDVSVGEDTNILSYEDAFEVSEYAVAAFQWAVGAGIIEGTGGKLLPQTPCTRAQMVTMLYRMLKE